MNEYFLTMVAGESRARFVEAAHRLFAEKGYAGTSVADIQSALGLAPGSGALYKHFSSKEVLLGEVVDIYISTIGADRASFLDQAPPDLRDGLEYVVDVVWAGMERDRDIIRVLLRDLEAFPDLLDKLWTAIREDVYRTFSVWLQDRHRREGFVVDDPDAVSAVLIAALTYRPILAMLIDRVPGDVEADRFRAAWVAVALAALDG